MYKHLKIKPTDNFEIHYREVIKCLNFFKAFLESHGINKLKKFLKQVREKELQFILQGILFSHFWAYEEILKGDGKFDFFIISPENNKIIIETKMSDDVDYLDGIKLQLPQYLDREKSKHGFFLLFYVDGTTKNIETVKEEIITERFKLFNKYKITEIIIDLRERESPSKMVSYSNLRKVKGIGHKRAEILTNAGFDSIESILTAPIEEISSKTNLPQDLINKIRNACKYFKTIY